MAGDRGGNYLSHITNFWKNFHSYLGTRITSSLNIWKFQTQTHSKIKISFTDSATIHKVNSTDDHQWIGQILLSSLAYKGEMSVTERHGIENYGKQIQGLNLSNINLMPSDLERMPE